MFSLGFGASVSFLRPASAAAAATMHAAWRSSRISSLAGRRYARCALLQRSFGSNHNGGSDTENKTDLPPQKSSAEPPYDDDSPLIVSQFKNQIVHQLWTERHKAKSSKSKNRKGLSSPGKGKTPSQSETQVEYPFSNDLLLAESYRSPWNTMRIGRLLEDLDALAGNIAFYHVRRQEEEESADDIVHPLIVTASVDRIQMRMEHSPSMPTDQVLSGRVTYVGTSSMEIRMHCTSVGEEKEWLEAYVTYVTLDPETKKPMHITPLLPETPQEQADFDLGAKRAAIKKQRRKQHQQVKEDVQKHAEILLQEARPLILNMPSLAARDSIQMSATKLHNAMIAQTTVRNLHNRIFGGFLMRRAFELAFANAYVFGGARPIFKEVDEISFAAPVDVGDLLMFNSRVLYTSSNNSDPNGVESGHTTGEKPLIHLEVEAWVTLPEKADAKLSNQFYFTFALEESEHNVPHQPLRKILPGNIDEATRMATRMEADRLQDTN